MSSRNAKLLLLLTNQTANLSAAALTPSSRAARLRLGAQRGCRAAANGPARRPRTHGELPGPDHERMPTRHARLGSGQPRLAPRTKAGYSTFMGPVYASVHEQLRLGSRHPRRAAACRTCAADAAAVRWSSSDSSCHARACQPSICTDKLVLANLARANGIHTAHAPRSYGCPARAHT